MPKTIWHTKKRILTEGELRDRKDSIVEHMQKINEIRALKKIEDKKFANQLKPHQTLVDEMMEQISTGVDEGTAQCEVQVDAVTQTVRFIKVTREWNADTDEYDYSRELFDEKTFEEVGEKQLSMWQGMEVDDSVEDLEDVLSDNENQWLWDDFIDERADSELYGETMDGLLTPMSSTAAKMFLENTGKPDSVFIQTIKNVGLRNALEMIKECALAVDEEDRLEFMRGVFADPLVGAALLDHLEEIPYRKPNEDDEDEDTEEEESGLVDAADAVAAGGDDE